MGWPSNLAWLDDITPGSPPPIEQGEPLQTRGSRGDDLVQVVGHEPVTTSHEQTLESLANDGLGVHFSVDRDGTIRQHADTALVVWHADEANDRSVAVECEWGYLPDYEPNARVIETPWAWKGRYAVPPMEQCEAFFQLLQWLKFDLGLRWTPNWLEGDPYPWRTVGMNFRGGFVSHGHLARDRSDCLFQIHAALAREAGFDTDEAYERTIEAAKAGGETTLHLPAEA